MVTGDRNFLFADDRQEASSSRAGQATGLKPCLDRTAHEKKNCAREVFFDVPFIRLARVPPDNLCLIWLACWALEFSHAFDVLLIFVRHHAACMLYEDEKGGSDFHAQTWQEPDRRGSFGEHGRTMTTSPSSNRLDGSLGLHGMAWVAKKVEYFFSLSLALLGSSKRL